MLESYDSAKKVYDAALEASRTIDTAIGEIFKGLSQAEQEDLHGADIALHAVLIKALIEPLQNRHPDLMTSECAMCNKRDN